MDVTFQPQNIEKWGMKVSREERKVTKLEEGRQAARKGVKLNWIVAAINGKNYEHLNNQIFKKEFREIYKGEATCVIKFSILSKIPIILFCFETGKFAFSKLAVPLSKIQSHPAF